MIRIRMTKHWFGPNIASRDLVDLFASNEWCRYVDVFKLYAQHILTLGQIGPNTYEALVAADAFRMLLRNDVEIAIEMGSVKEGSPTACDASDNIRAFHAINERVTNAGGRISYIAMDEPMVARTLCGQTIKENAERVAAFIRVATWHGARVGWIEAWPHSTFAQQQEFLYWLREFNAIPYFWHLDLDTRLALAKRDPFTAYKAQKQVRSVADHFGIELGVILAGYDADSDGAYLADVRQLAATVLPMTSWNHVITQAWAKDLRTNLQTIPDNFPTHVQLVKDIVLQENLPPPQAWKEPSIWQRFLRLWR